MWPKRGNCRTAHVTQRYIVLVRRRAGRVAGVLAAAAIAGMATACSATGGQPTAAAPPVTVTTTDTTTATATATRTPAPVTATVTVTESVTVSATESPAEPFPPAGYDDWGAGVAAKWADDAAFECPEESESCWGVDIFSANGCPNGVFLALDLYREEQQVDTLDATTSAMNAGDNLQVVLGQSGNGTGLTAELVTVTCT